MVRARWMSLMVVANLLLTSGCCFCLPERPWFGRRCCRNGNGTECCGMAPGETMVSEGPILADVAPGPPGTVLNAPAPTTAPQLSPPPSRIEPRAAPTMPYQPTRRAAN